MRQIIPNVYTFDNLIMGRVYLIDDGGELSLIDTGLALAGDRILKQITDSGRQIAQVKHILITHAHLDHVGSLDKLKAATGAQVIASAEDAPIVEGKQDPPLPDRKTLPFPHNLIPVSAKAASKTPVDRIVADDDTLPGGLQVIATPGHSYGHVSYYHPALKLLFTGDVLFHMTGMGLPLRPATPDMEMNKRSIGKLCAFDIEIACFGHGQPILRGAGDQIRAFARKLGVA